MPKDSGKPKEIKTKCKHCNKAIRSINNDWKSREYHKKCYKEIEDMKMMMITLEKYQRMYNL